MLEMRRLVKQGFLGGKPVHLESYWSYDLGDLRLRQCIPRQPYSLGAPITRAIISQHHQSWDRQAGGVSR